VRRRIVGPEATGQLLGLGARTRHVAGEAEQAHEEPARGHVVRVRGQIPAEEGDCLLFPMLAGERLRPVRRRGTRAPRAAPRAKGDDERHPKRGMPRENPHPGAFGAWHISTRSRPSASSARARWAAASRRSPLPRASTSCWSTRRSIWPTAGKKRSPPPPARQVEKGKMTQQASTTLLARVEPSAGVEDFRT